LPPVSIPAGEGPSGAATGPIPKFVTPGTKMAETAAKTASRAKPQPLPLVATPDQIAEHEAQMKLWTMRAKTNGMYSASEGAVIKPLTYGERIGKRIPMSNTAPTEYPGARPNTPTPWVGPRPVMGSEREIMA